MDVINKGPNHNESQYALQVISLPKDPDYIGVRFNGICRNGSDTCGSIKISGPNQSKVTKDSPYAFNVKTKQQNNKAKSFTNFIAQYFRPTIGDGLIPEKYIVETQSCTGADTYKALVQTFPNFYWV